MNPQKEIKSGEKQIMNRRTDHVAFTEAKLGSMKSCVYMSFNETQCAADITLFQVSKYSCHVYFSNHVF